VAIRRTGIPAATLGVAFATKEQPVTGSERIIGRPEAIQKTGFWEMRRGPPAVNSRGNEKSNNQADAAPSLAVVRCTPIHL
jgi:hypothetical protein